MGAELDRVVHLVASKVGQESSEFLWFAAVGVWLAWLEDLSWVFSSDCEGSSVFDVLLVEHLTFFCFLAEIVGDVGDVGDFSF
ncbi:unnamed protein product [Fusarium graminearum]|nr:unnamed protein product [Fusarium graminearum]